jgi:hypothetical protein
MEASSAQFHCALSAARILLLGTPAFVAAGSRDRFYARRGEDQFLPSTGQGHIHDVSLFHVDNWLAVLKLDELITSDDISIDLLTAYKVAREFESISLRQAVWPAGDYPDRVVESARVRRLAAIKVHRRKSILCDSVHKWAGSL